jgi:DNA-binding NtrC family response regulator
MALLSLTWHRSENPEPGKTLDVSQLYRQGALAKHVRETAASEWLLIPGNAFVQLFVVASPAEFTAFRFAQLLSQLGFADGLSAEEVQVVNDGEAVRQFLRSAVGVLPDGDIQLDHAEKFRQAYTQALELGFCGAQFNRLFQRAVWLHERLRLETPLYHRATDRTELVAELIGKIFGHQQVRSVLVAGTSPEAPGLLARLSSMGFCQVRQTPAERSPADAPTTIADHTVNDTQVDIVLRFDDSSLFSMERSDLQKFMEARNNAPLLVVDLRRPSAPSPPLKLYNLYFYNRADLDQMVARHRQELRAVVSGAQPWFDEEAQQFLAWRNSEERFHYGSMVGCSPQMLRVFELIARIAQNDITVLIEGESGTGKELVARAIHQASSRARRPFIVVNCGAMPETLLESELFGHVRGAFTGAINNKRGLFEEANDGTIFLDEVAETSPALQVKLLRFLQHGEVKRVGSNEVLYLNVRVLAATNRGLEKMTAEGAFRSDLYYRLNVIQIVMPSLRERVEDIPLLARHFLKKASLMMKKSTREISTEALALLKAYTWPGNVRELENVMERAAALALGDLITPADLPAQIQEAGLAVLSSNGRLTLKDIERRHILETLDALDWNYDEACRTLGIGRTTLWRKLKEYQVPGKE